MPFPDQLRSGLVIPAHPLALNANRQLDERRQRALTRYYLAAGAGGIAVGVHTTQFAIHSPKHQLLKRVLELAVEETRGREVVKVAGVCGKRKKFRKSLGMMHRDVEPDNGAIAPTDHCSLVDFEKIH